MVTEEETRSNPSNKRKTEIIRKGIERAMKKLRQIISINLTESSRNISLIKKHKMINVPAIHTAVENIQKSLQKYLKFSEVDYDYCNDMNEFLDSAENWCLRVEDMYNKAEVQSINTSKGDSADVGVFSDNANVKVFEFLEAAEIAYLGWGNSAQKGNRLFNRHLSEEMKSKLIHMSDLYVDMKNWLILNYGGVSRIVSDILNDLGRKTKPNPNNSAAKYAFYRMELENCVYSRATLNSLSLILPAEAYADWITEMTRTGLDYKNPVGVEAYKVFKNLCIIERDKSEGSLGITAIKPRSPRSPRSPKIKRKSYHKITEVDGEKSDEE